MEMDRYYTLAEGIVGSPPAFLLYVMHPPAVD